MGTVPFSTRDERPAGDQRVDVWAPVQQFSVSLNRGYHAGLYVVAAEQPADFVLDARYGYPIDSTDPYMLWLASLPPTIIL